MRRSQRRPLQTHKGTHQAAEWRATQQPLDSGLAPACLHAQLWGLVPVSLGMAPLGQEQRRAYASAFTETEQMSLGVSVDAVRVHTALPCDCSHEGAAQVWQRRQQRRHGTLSGSRAAAK